MNGCLPRTVGKRESPNIHQLAAILVDTLRRRKFTAKPRPRSLTKGNQNLNDRLKVLFVCSKNQWRSPTAEKVYCRDERVSVRSRGTARSAVRTITAADLHWADLVLVMEEKHRNRIRAEFPQASRRSQIHVLDVPDDYQFMDDELVELIRSATDPIFSQHT